MSLVIQKSIGHADGDAKFSSQLECDKTEIYVNTSALPMQPEMKTENVLNKTQSATHIDSNDLFKAKRFDSRKPSSEPNVAHSCCDGGSTLSEGHDADPSESLDLQLRAKTSYELCHEMDTADISSVPDEPGCCGDCLHSNEYLNGGKNSECSSGQRVTDDDSTSERRGGVEHMGKDQSESEQTCIIKDTELQCDYRPEFESSHSQFGMKFESHADVIRAVAANTDEADRSGADEMIVDSALSSDDVDVTVYSARTDDVVVGTCDKKQVVGDDVSNLAEVLNETPTKVDSDGGMLHCLSVSRSCNRINI